jgi:hypothetical protein
MIKKLFGLFGASSDDVAPKEQERFKYCPSCREEFRFGFSFCPACNVELVEELGQGERDFFAQRKSDPVNQEITSADELVGIQQGPLIELRRLKAILAQAGVPSLFYVDPAAPKG